jgi:hypothetical protein
MRLQRKLIGSGAVLLALGGIGTATAMAQTSGASTPPAVHAPAAKATTTEPVSAADTDNVQQGDQTASDAPAAKGGAKADSTSETETAGESETGPSDGPGGHEDPPGNIDNQQTGEN